MRFTAVSSILLWKNTSPFPQKEFSIWKFVEEPDFTSMQKIHGFRYPEVENFIPLHFSKEISETVLYAVQGNKLLRVEFTGKVVRKQELAALDNDIRVIKAEVSKEKILLAYIAKGQPRNWILAEYDIHTKVFSRKVLKRVTCAAADTSPPVITKDGICFVSTDTDSKISVVTKTDRQGNFIAKSQELPLTSPMLVQGVDGLIAACADSITDMTVTMFMCLIQN